MSLWPPVSAAAASTPADRDRVIDAVRGASLVVVVFGHLLLAVVYWPEGEVPRLGSILLAYPWTQALTWVLQVMPLFFAFGGAANALSWERAHARGTGYSAWMWGRTQRLLRPVLVYLAIAAVAAWIAREVWGEVAGPLLGQLGVQLWFLGVYLVTTALLPVMLAWHRRSAAAAFVTLVPLVVVINVGTTILGWPLLLGMANVVLVWLLLQQLGFFWSGGPRQSSPRRWAAIGSASLALGLLLVTWGPWPMSLISIPGDRLDYESLSLYGWAVGVPGYSGEYSNMFPPSIVLLLQGIALVAVVFVLRRPLTVLLHRSRVWWTATGMNLTAMSLYLWHVPAIMLAFVVLHLVGADPPTEIGAAGYPVPVQAGEYFAWFALLLAVFVLLLAAFVTVFWSTEFRPLPWWDSMPRLGLTGSGPGPRAVVTALGTLVLGVSFLVFAIVGLRGFPTETRYWSGVPVNALWGLIGVVLGSVLLRMAAARRD